MEMEAVTIRDSTSEVVVVDNIDSLENTVDSGPVLRLRLKKPKPDRQVAWKEGTIDNEDMGKKKSKCCCIYKKPVNFGESSSSDDEECEHCFGHPEKRRKNVKKNQDAAHDEERTYSSDIEHNSSQDNNNLE
ncbi:protein phosphatase 1 regulatory subunit 11 [Ceratitis capitata]|uniref:E3 ubiquitin-protein ligase PPP1R11 n=1 Tax=Ceratitis capitata TaxID=7213 RepID=W8CBC8_CERCA|nr:protein phosphatase 1 regulatory subunit 11 [Ceratitis capitata]XP_012159854.1 protein phosphatase 1 regulatory subunit 11 [Ceratitis capitata]CAD6997638.1 unnamed protein product [Ceratitis capitata]